MIAHVSGLPVEELLPPLTGGGLMLGWALLGRKLREWLGSRR